MTPNDIEDALADDEKITPSPRLLSSVMAAVHSEAAAPRPLEFPWLRALPGLLATIAALAVATWYGVGSLRDSAASAALDMDLRELMAVAAGFGLQWIALAVAVTVVSLWLPLRLTRPRASPLSA